ncbi:DUF2553 family protein [Staphylospora marina]|uniref:DUF2553 family protein n=1 Tax=Staphylospora marina TaxID=2490858 RepID=UPI0013DE26AA|nr:DUF2553 family protein [Staphylospora marina]
MKAGRIDITDRVTAKLQDGEWVLYYNHKPIGRFVPDSAGTDMSEGFELDNGRLYAAYPDERNRLQGNYADDCDIGWC